MMMTLCSVKNVPATRKTFWLYGVSNAYGIGPNQASIAFCIMVETPMVAISGKQLAALVPQRREDRDD